MKNSKKRILSGMRPTGPLHVGHLLGTIENWKRLQNEYHCYFMVADWHALMGEYEAPDKIREYVVDNVRDWLSCGIDPEKCVIFRQSEVVAHTELHLVFSVITPLPWLERCPTYKEQLREVRGRDLMTYGFLGYPVLQAADILLYKADAVPVGEDQLPHVELTREIARRFNTLFGKEVFPSPEAKLTKMPRVLGTDNRKMSKSYGNYIALSDDPETVGKKVRTMITDPEKLRKGDPGKPEICNVFSFHGFFDENATELNEIYAACRAGTLGCVECKKRLANTMVAALEPVHEARKKINRSTVLDILAHGRQAAEGVASQTMSEVKEVTGLQ